LCYNNIEHGYAFYGRVQKNIVKLGAEVIMKKKTLIFTFLFVLLVSFSLVACNGGSGNDTNDQGNSGEENPELNSFTGLTFESLTVDYDGTEHSVEIAGTLPEGASVSYTSNKATDAGVYNAVATVTCEGYNTKTLNATLTINKINYDMSGASWSTVTEYTYDTTEKSVTLSGLPEGVTVKSYSGNKATDAGDYVASAALNYDTKNYNEPTVADCAWKINKAQITVNVEFSGASYEYDTQMHSLAIIGNIPAGTTVVYTYNGENVVGVTEVGEYAVVATISGKNYHTLTLNATLTIKSTEKLLYAVNHNGIIYLFRVIVNSKSKAGMRKKRIGLTYKKDSK
jgi:predicted small secreted protein